jgi:transcription-repair coupling factor (superfamily II helicase)
LELVSLLRNNLPRTLSGNCRVSNLTGSSAALLLALEERPFVAVEMDEAGAETLRKDINFYRRMLSGKDVLFLPDPNGAETSGARAKLLHILQESDSLVTSSRNLVTSLRDRGAPGEYTMWLRTGGALSRAALEESLVHLGYRNVPMVVERGEYSRRGWVLDIFPSTADDPLRLEFFGDEIERVRTFDVETQRSGEDIPEFSLFPAVEPEGTRSLSLLMPRKRFYCLYPVRDRSEFPEDTVFLSRYSFESEGDAAYAGIRETVLQRDAGSLSMRGHGILPDERKGIGDLPAAIRRLSEKNRVILIASSTGQSERVRDIFGEHEVIVPLVGIRELVDFGGNICMSRGDLSSGLFFNGLLILTAKEIFGERPAYRPLKKSRVSNLLVSLDEISPGDFVVHRDHGIGRFSRVVRQRVDDNEFEMILIEYEDGKIYIPIQNIGILSKFRAEEGVVPRIDKLSGKTWQRKKERARKKANEIAERLVTLYAGRRASRGFMFSRDTELHREFDSFFSYEETTDQLKAIEDIKKDMESEKPMDRLLCGDVGYGKTEVAMRAAFKAVYDNRQVAVLVPTTILAEQHYRTFRERFSGFPVSVDFISRLKSKKETERTLRGAARGEIDIVIGTHALLSKKTAFQRLGLLIIDEEHRFGVGQKERIKELRRNIDVLTLTATPIPRTLHMALSGIREISVIETPPEERLAVKSVVTPFNEALIRESIERELGRKGQVFFVHNRISDIYAIARYIQGLVSSAEVGVVHGQMPEKELEDAMHRFFEGRINVLVSTAIVGSGLDIPRANTIIIDKADKMGLADLYQLRGRVGRSNLKGYAFFLAADESLLTEEARKRLQAVQEMSYLGAGFRLALKDLEIRGAGEVFGAEQSGRIHDIGFDLYMEMLEKAVADLKGIEIKEEPEPLIEMKASALIPEEYVADVTLRLSLYRRISSLKTEEELVGLEAELGDRFGSPPREVINLLRIMKLKMFARLLAVTKIQEAGGRINIVFSPETTVQPSHIFALKERRKDAVRLLPDGVAIEMRDDNREGFLEEVRKVMEELTENVDSHIPREE